MHELLLRLSESECIKIVAENNVRLNKLDRYWDELQAYFLDENGEAICIGEQTAIAFLGVFISTLQKSIENKLQLHESIVRNLGFMKNEYRYNLPDTNPDFIMIPMPGEKSNYWIGVDYQIWLTYTTTSPMATTWMYNDADGSIVLEITPLYKWPYFTDDCLNEPDFITYEAFMSNYKPLFKRIIPRETALLWLEQTTKVYKSMFASEEDYLRECKENRW